MTDSSPEALFAREPPRDPAALRPLIRAATRLHRVVFYCAVGLAVVLGAIVVAGADRDKVLTVLPASLVPSVMIGAPFLVFWLRGRRRLMALAVNGERHRAQVTVSDIIHVGYGATTNRIVAQFSADGVDYVTQLAVGGPKPHHAVGDEIDLLFSPASPGVIIAHSTSVGVVLGRTLAKEAAAAPRRARRIIIGVVIGSLLFFGMMALLYLRYGR